MIRRLWSLILKEFQIVWRDPRSRYFLLVPPFVQAFLFGFAATLEVSHASLAILNHDSGQSARELVERLRDAPVFTGAYLPASRTQMSDLIDRRAAMLAIVIPPTFTRDILAGRGGEVQAIVDGRRSNSGQIALGYASEIINRAIADGTLRPDAAGASGLKSVDVESRCWFNENKIYQWVTVPGLIGIIMALEAMLLTGLSVARERELGTFDQLLVSPLTPLEIILGKTIPTMVIGMGEGLLIFFLALWFFQVPFRGDFLLLALGMFVYLLAMTGVGLFISSLAQTQQQALLGMFLGLMPIVLLSGFMTPVENMPAWLQTGTLWNPLRHFLVIVKAVFLKDASIGMLTGELGTLTLISFCTLGAAGWLFRRRLG